MKKTSGGRRSTERKHSQRAKRERKHTSLRHHERHKEERKAVRVVKQDVRLQREKEKREKNVAAGVEHGNEKRKLIALKTLRKEQGVKGFRPNTKKFLFFLSLLAALVIVIGLVMYRQFGILVALLLILLFTFGYLIVRKRLKRYQDIQKMELAFPDFVALMAANLRAGMTVDRALLMSARKEFAPLDSEITKLGKDIVTGKEISKALLAMSERIQSEEIRKTVLLIISGIRSGGNLSVLLEHVASNMRERVFVKKRAASNVLMYVIFIFFAVSIGAPLLFGLSTVLVDVLSGLVADLPADQTVNVRLPFSLTEISVSSTFILYFAIFFMIMSDFFAALVLGLVGKGQEREGLKFLIPMILLSIGFFFAARLVLLRYFGGFLG